MLASWGQEELAAGDQFSFNNDSIPCSVELDSECAYWSASVKNTSTGFTLGSRVDCSNPDRDHLDAKEPKRGGGGGGGSAAILPAATQLSSPNHFPASKVHAVSARYKKEILDNLLKDAPECAYDLSLKDLVVVDLPRIAKPGRQDAPRLTKGTASSPNSKSRAGGRKEKVQKRRSKIKGFFLKIFFRRNKSSGGSSRDGSKSGNKSLMKDGGKAGAAKRSGKQQPALLEKMDPSRRPRGCCHLFQNSKKQSSKKQSIMA